VKFSKRIVLLIALVPLVALVFLLLHSSNQPSGKRSANPVGKATLSNPDRVAMANTNPPVSAPSNPAPLIGETILHDYAKTNFPPENDLTLMAHLMDNFTLLVKSASDRPLSANEDWAAMFRGFNPAHERFLSDNHIALNARGQLVDRWGTPLFFHALGGRRFDIRSAGPDGKLWTKDDIHRNSDGSFLHGSQLNPPSLLEAHPSR
jgi:hypothetical protein